MRVLLCLALVACQPEPAKPVAAPKPAPITSDGPSWIGVRLDTTTPRITQLVRGAPGERAGLKIGDLVLTLDGTKLESSTDLVRRVLRTPPGTPIAIVVSRGGFDITLKVIAEARPDSPAKNALLDKPAPSFSAQQLSGPYAAKLAEHRGHVVIVDFWATWCGPCALTIPRLKELAARHEDLRIIGLSNEDAGVIKKFVDDVQITYAIGRDPDDEISQQYLREGIPMFVVIDKQGVVRHVIVGANMDAVDEAIPPLL